MICHKSDIETLVSQFQACTLPREQWTHQAHLTIAFWYLMQEPLPAAIQTIRAGIQQYNAAKGIFLTPNSGYHETLTLFWILLIYQYIQKHRESDFVRLLNELLAIYADPRLPFQYYSRDRLMSWEARTTWLEPDLQSLVFPE